jgi:hypothetical protein
VPQAPGVSNNSGDELERVLAIGGLSAARKVKTTEYFDCPVVFRPAA